MIRSGTIGPSAGAAIAQMHQQQLQQQQAAFLSAPNTPNNVAGSGDSTPTGTPNSNGEEIKPRSLRFTWSMKTTSSLAPDEMMK